MTSLRLIAIAVLLFLVVAVDFTSKLMSMVADGVLVAGVLSIAWPMLKTKK